MEVPGQCHFATILYSQYSLSLCGPRLVRYRNNREQKGFECNSPRFPAARADLTPGPGMYTGDEPLDGGDPEPVRGKGAYFAFKIFQNTCTCI